MVLTRVPGGIEYHDRLLPDVPGRRVIDAPADCAQFGEVPGHDRTFAIVTGKADE
jgi:hypothetical protein